jgi:hypothetical protein
LAQGTAGVNESIKNAFFFNLFLFFLSWTHFVTLKVSHKGRPATNSLFRVSANPKILHTHFFFLVPDSLHHITGISHGPATDFIFVLIPDSFILSFYVLDSIYRYLARAGLPQTSFVRRRKRANPKILQRPQTTGPCLPRCPQV